MPTVEFRIQVNEGEWSRVDIDRNTSFPITLQVKDITEPTTTKTPYSAQIIIPRTKNNDNLFGHIYKVDWKILNFNPLIRTNFLLHVDNSLFQSGYIKLEVITRKDYRISLFGGLNDYFYTMSEVSDERNMELRNLPFDGFFDHKINRQLVVNCWTGARYNNEAGQDLREHIAYIPTYQGQYDNFNSDKIIRDGSDEEQDVTWQSGERVWGNVDINEHERSQIRNDQFQYYGEYRSYYQKPMVRFKTIFNKIVGNPAEGVRGVMQDEGWETELDDTFFHKDNPYWNDLWMICQNYDTTDNTGGNKLPVKNTIADPPTAPTDSKDYFHWEGLNVNYQRAQLPADGYVKGTDIKPNTEYTIGYNLDFKLKAVLARLGEAPGRQIGYHLSGYLTGKIWIGNKSFPLTFSNTGEQQLTLDHNTIARKVPDDFPSPGPTWPSRSQNQPFYLRYINGESITTDQSTIEGTTFNCKGLITTQMLGTFATAPDDVYFEFTFNGSTWWYRGGVKQYGLGVEADLESSYITISEPDAMGLRSGSTVRFENLINSNLTCYQFVMSYCKTFGLYFEKSVAEKRVRIVTRNTFFERGERIDWTERIDLNRDYALNPVPFDYKTGIFKWNELGTKYEDQYFSETSKEYGSVRFHTGYQFTDEEKELTDPMIYDNCVVAQGYSQYFLGRDSVTYRDNKVLPYLMDNSGAGVDNGFILAFSNGVVSPIDEIGFIVTDDTEDMFINGYCWTDASGYIAPCYTYLQATRTLVSGDSTYSLNFGSPWTAYNDQEAQIVDQGGSDRGNQTIYGRFWKGYLEDLFSAENRVLTCFVKLRRNEIQDNIFNKFIFINNTPWVVNKVYNYNPVSEAPTKVELIKVQSLNAYTSQRYSAGNLIIRRSGSVIYDSAGEVGPATNPVIINLDPQSYSITLSLDSTADWTIDDVQEGITVRPTSGAGGTVTSVTITVPENTTGELVAYTVPIKWGNTRTLVQLVQRGSWTVTGTSANGTVLVNGEPSPGEVNNNQFAELTVQPDDGYAIAYWIVDGVTYYSESVSVQVTKDVTAEAIMYRPADVYWTNDTMTADPNGETLSNTLNMPTILRFQNVTLTNGTATPTTGTGTTAVSFTIQPNNTTTARQMTVSADVYSGTRLLSTQTFTIEQDFIRVLYVEPETYDAPNEVHQYGILVYANTAWSATVDGSWYTVDRLSGDGIEYIFVTTTVNRTGAERTGRITFTNFDHSITVNHTLAQEFGTATVIIDPNLFEVGSARERESNIGLPYDEIKYDISTRIRSIDTITAPKFITITNPTYQFFIFPFDSQGLFIGNDATWMDAGTLYEVNSETAYFALILCRVDQADIVPADVPDIGITLYN